MSKRIIKWLDELYLINTTVKSSVAEIGDKELVVNIQLTSLKNLKRVCQINSTARRGNLNVR